MNHQEFAPMRDMRQITCILYKGGGLQVLEALHKRGVNAASLHHARGSAIGDPAGRNGIPEIFEKEILTVVVSAEEADEIFDFVFEAAKIDRPHGGFLYMERLQLSVPFVLPSVPEEKSA